MKKILFVLLMAFCLVVPMAAKAEVKTMNLKEALQEDEITLDKAFETYKENDDQAIVYIFRGHGCGFCHALLEFLNSIVGEYGKYFKVISYEVWYNEDNAKLMKEVGDYLGQPAEGVPYVVIGDKVFGGYSESWNEEIKTAIKTLYDTKKSKRYDVMVEMVENPKDENGNVVKSSPSTLAIILCTILATVAGVGVTVAFVNYKFAALEDKLDLLKDNKKVETPVQVVVEEKKEKVPEKKVKGTKKTSKKK